MKRLSKKEVQEKLKGYEEAIENVRKWWPKTGKPESEEDAKRIEAWRTKTIKGIENGREKFLAQTQPKEVDMDKPRLAEVKTMEATLKRDVTVGEIVRSEKGVSLKGTRKLKAGLKVTLSFVEKAKDGILILRGRLEKGASFYMLLKSTVVGAQFLSGLFQPVTKAWHIGSFIPKKMKKEVLEKPIAIGSAKAKAPKKIEEKKQKAA